MFNVFYYQTPLLMPVMSIVFTLLLQTIHRSVVVVILKVILYSVVPLVNLLWTLNVLHYHKLHGTTNMNIPSTSVILLRMALVNITVIFVKKNEIPSNGSTTVKSATFPLIVTVFLGKIQMSSNTYNDH